MLLNTFHCGWAPHTRSNKTKPFLIGLQCFCFTHVFDPLYRRPTRAQILTQIYVLIMNLFSFQKVGSLRRSKHGSCEPSAFPQVPEPTHERRSVLIGRGSQQHGTDPNHDGSQVLIQALSASSRSHFVSYACFSCVQFYFSEI